MLEGQNHRVIVVDANRRPLLTSPSFSEYEQAHTFAITLQECIWHEARPAEIIVQTRDPAPAGDPVDAPEDPFSDVEVLDLVHAASHGRLE